MTFDDFKEGFVAVLSQAIEQLSSSEDEDPSDSTAGIQHKKYAMQEKIYMGSATASCSLLTFYLNNLKFYDFLL